MEVNKLVCTFALDFKFNTMSKEKNKATLVLSHKGAAEYIKSPFSVVSMLGPMSLVQQRIVANIIANVQTKVQYHLDHLKERRENNEYLLFSDKEFENGFKRFDIQLSDVCHLPSEYRELDDAAEKLSRLMVPCTFYENGASFEAPVQFLKVFVPTSNGEGRRRAGYLIVKIDEDVSRMYFHMKSGYAEHLKRIVNMCKCSKTPVLYEYLSRYFKQDATHVVSYKELRKVLGADYYENEPLKDDSGEVVTIDGKIQMITKSVSKYPRFVDFKRRILKAAVDEIQTLWDEGKIDFAVKCDALEEGKRADLSNITFTMDTTRRKNVEVTSAKEKDDFSNYMNLYCMGVVGEVGEDVAEIWMKPAILKIVKVTQEEVTIAFPVRATWEMWYENVGAKCSNGSSVWSSVFGEAKFNPIIRDDLFS